MQHLAEELNNKMVASVLPVTIFIGLETVLGFCGNILVLYVFLFRYHKCNFKYFVLCLACIDVVSTLTTMPGEIITHEFWYVYPYPIVCKIKSFFNVSTVCGSAFCLLLIAVDRFRKLCRPLQWQLKPKTALVLCFVLLVISCIIALPVAVLWGTHSYQESYKGYEVTVTVCEKDAKYLHTEYPLIYATVVEIIISSVMVGLFILYIFVCRKLLRVRLHSDVTNDANEAVKERNVTEDDTTLSHGMTSEDDLHITKHRSDKNEIAQHSISTAVELKNKGNTEQKVEMVNKIKQKKSTTKPKTRRIRTLIMFILTAIFVFTTILYLTLLNLIANDFLQSLSSTAKSFYFFFFRLYFINHVINPILYGWLDPHFRRILMQIMKSMKNVRLCSTKNANSRRRH